LFFGKKGDINIETIFAVIFALGVLLLVLSQTTQHKDEIKILEQITKEKNQCNVMAGLISLMNSNESNDTIEINVEFSSTISGSTITIQNQWCTFSGDAQAIVLSSGKIKLSEENGAVKLENV